jgi:hypothetical protein
MGLTKHVEHDGFDLEDLVYPLIMNRPRTHEDTVDIRRHTDEEPEANRLRGGVILKRPLPDEDTIHIRTQTETELEQKRPRTRREGGGYGKGAKRSQWGFWRSGNSERKPS